MKRIILHWTAGTHKPNSDDLEPYHFIIDGDGKIHKGKHPVSANKGPLVAGKYAAHTSKCNTGSIGVAIAAMEGADDSPLNVGKYPITQTQEMALYKLVASLAKEYTIPITRTSVLTHAEVQPTLKIPQNGKWDIRWLPGMKKIGDAVEIGDIIRSKIKVEQRRLEPDNQPTVPTPETAKKESWITKLLKILWSFLDRKD